MSQLSVDVVLLDMQLPGKLGMEILTEIRANYPVTKVIVMSGLPASQYARHVMRAGATSYISKGGDLGEILAAVQAAVSGHLYVAGEVRQLLATDLQFDPTKAPHERLTVSTYRTRLLEKMTLPNNAELTAYAYRHSIPHRWLEGGSEPDP